MKRTGELKHARQLAYWSYLLSHYFPFTKKERDPTKRLDITRDELLEVEHDLHLMSLVSDRVSRDLRRRGVRTKALYPVKNASHELVLRQKLERERGVFFDYVFEKDKSGYSITPQKVENELYENTLTDYFVKRGRYKAAMKTAINEMSLDELKERREILSGNKALKEAAPKLHKDVMKVLDKRIKRENRKIKAKKITHSLLP